MKMFVVARVKRRRRQTMKTKLYERRKEREKERERAKCEYFSTIPYARTFIEI
tara:strand:+ start:1172 stop:1330 length:159 start_codon:yes stop_codon:yes gene_type:complete